jgi:hypothetical protein
LVKEFVDLKIYFDCVIVFYGFNKEMERLRTGDLRYREC